MRTTAAAPDLFGYIPKIRMAHSSVAEGKECTKCHKYKSIRFYSRNSNSNDGYRSTCKVCDRESQRASRAKMTYIEIEYKQCTDCGRIKPIAEFGLDKTKKDGHRSYCLDCLRDRSNMRLNNSHTKTRKNKQ